MGKGTHGVTASPEKLKREVEEIREEMTPVLDELDHRRHELTDWKLQLRRQRPTLIRAAAVIAALFLVRRLVRSRRSRSVRRRRLATMAAGGI